MAISGTSGSSMSGDARRPHKAVSKAPNGDAHIAYFKTAPFALKYLHKCGSLFKHCLVRCPQWLLL